MNVTYEDVQPIQERTQRGFVSSEYKATELTIKDHNGNDVRLVWCPKSRKRKDGNRIPPFPYQVYLTRNTGSAVQDPSFPSVFASFIEWLIGKPESEPFRPLETLISHHVEVYSQPFTNILACIEHQRREVLHRNRNGIWPRLIDHWTTSDVDGYIGRIIVIDRDSWQEEGMVFVSFDPIAYRVPLEFDSWSYISGDRDGVQAIRAFGRDNVKEYLRKWWMDAGHRWEEDDLNRRNAGGVSPALYPAVDPAAHHDALHEDVFELDGTALPGPGDQQHVEELEDEDGNPPIKRIVDESDLFKRPEEFPSFVTETYSDSFGLPITSIWDTKHSKLRPNYSITLYLGFGMLPLEPKALFGCLNRGLIEREAWTLDIVRNMPNLSAAFDYHARASYRRSSTRTTQTRAWAQMILQNVVGDKLPNELKEYIEDLLVPPPIPDYSSRLIRPFQDVFLYLDENCLRMGPQLIYSKPIPSKARTSLSVSKPGTMAEYSRRGTFQERLLSVRNLRFWHRVADEIHILWSLCSYRLAMYDRRPRPRVELKLVLARGSPPPSTSRGLFSVPGEFANVSLKMSSQDSILIREPPLSHRFWEEALEILDLSTGLVLPQLPSYEYIHRISCYDSWARSRELGFAEWPNANLYLGETLSVDDSYGIRENPASDFYQDTEGMRFTEGHEYALRLRPGVTIPSWTFGAGEDLEGPLNLPPLPVTMEEVRFTYRRPSRQEE